MFLFPVALFGYIIIDIDQMCIRAQNVLYFVFSKCVEFTFDTFAIGIKSRIKATFGGCHFSFYKLYCFEYNHFVKLITSVLIAFCV